jgi:hypothetical protein
VTGREFAGKGLSQLKKIETLTISGPKFNDDSLKKLEGMTGLKKLVVYRIGVTDAGLDQLRSKLPKCDIHKIF